MGASNAQKAKQAAEAKKALDAKKIADAAAGAKQEPTEAEKAKAIADAKAVADAKTVADAKAIANAKAPALKAGAFVNPFERGVSYKDFLAAIPKGKTVETFCKGKIEASQIKWLVNDLKEFKKKK